MLSHHHSRLIGTSICVHFTWEERHLIKVGFSNLPMRLIARTFQGILFSKLVERCADLGHRRRTSTQSRRSILSSWMCEYGSWIIVFAEEIFLLACDLTTKKCRNSYTSSPKSSSQTLLRKTAILLIQSKPKSFADGTRLF